MKEIKKEEMMLESASGFSMPFASEEPVQVTLGYGQQLHPHTGEKFLHHGYDFVANHVALYAVGSGTVVGVGNDNVHENYIVARYGRYDVKYGHVSEAYCNYGTSITAGQQIATSGDFLHLGVKFDGVDIDPKDFLAMLLANVQQLEAMGIKKDPLLLNMGINVHTDYDRDQNEIMALMIRYLPMYMNDIQAGSYQSPNRMQQSLRNIFSQSSSKNYFFEEIPDMGNPLGLSSRAAPLAGKVQNLLIGDFLNYMALRHNTYLSSWSEAQKKNFLTRQQKME